MKIALSTSVIQRGKTGVAQYVFALVKALLPHASKHQFHLLVLEEDLPLFAFADGPMRLVPVAERWRPALRNIAWHQAVLPTWLRQQKMEVLHIPSYRRMLAVAPCARVSTIHDLAPFHVQGKYDWARTFYGRVVVRQLARRQDAIIAISENTGRDVRQFFGVPPHRLQVILNGIDHERFRPAPSAAAVAETSQRWALERPFFLYVSRLEHPAKNHVRLMEAFHQFKTQTGSDWLLAFGGSDWHGAEHIHATAKGSPFARDIRFLGFVPDQDLAQLYRTASAMVYPSLFEGFGLPPVEAMACGCPVASSTRGSLAEVIGDAALVLDPESISSMVSAFSSLATQPTLRARLREAGYRNARRFDWQANAARVMEVYERTAFEFDEAGNSGCRSLPSSKPK